MKNENLYKSIFKDAFCFKKHKVMFFTKYLNPDIIHLDSKKIESSSYYSNDVVDWSVINFSCSDPEQNLSEYEVVCEYLGKGGYSNLYVKKYNDELSDYELLPISEDSFGSSSSPSSPSGWESVEYELHTNSKGEIISIDIFNVPSVELYIEAVDQVKNLTLRATVKVTNFKEGGKLIVPILNRSGEESITISTKYDTLDGSIELPKIEGWKVYKLSEGEFLQRTLQTLRDNSGLETEPDITVVSYIKEKGNINELFNSKPSIENCFLNCEFHDKIFHKHPFINVFPNTILNNTDKFSPPNKDICIPVPNLYFIFNQTDLIGIIKLKSKDSEDSICKNYLNGLISTISNTIKENFGEENESESWSKYITFDNLFLYIKLFTSMNYFMPNVLMMNLSFENYEKQPPHFQNLHLNQIGDHEKNKNMNNLYNDLNLFEQSVYKDISLRDIKPATRFYLYDVVNNFPEKPLSFIPKLFFVNPIDAYDAGNNFLKNLLCGGDSSYSSSSESRIFVTPPIFDGDYIKLYTQPSTTLYELPVNYPFGV